MSYMVGLVSKAISDAGMQYKAENGGDSCGWADIPDEVFARAAIAAMRDPTKAMCKAAAKALSPEMRPTPEYIPVSAKHRLRWQAMVDEALK